MVRTIDILDAPEIPGLRFRHFQGESDYPHMYAVFIRCLDVHGLFDTLESFVNFHNHCRNSDPGADIIVAEVGDQVVGFGRVMWWEEGNGEVIYFSEIGRVIPEWRQKGIGRAILRWSEARLREIAERHLEEGLYPPDRPRFFGVSRFEDRAVGIGALIRGEGYEPVTYYLEMAHDLEHIPEAPMPEGLEVRPARPEHFRAIWEAKVEAFRGHWGTPERTEEDYQRFLGDPIVMQPELWKVAWDGDEVAGQVMGFINHAEIEALDRKRGWTEYISVRRPWRRRGLARSLLAQTLHALKEAGMTEAALEVHLENPNDPLRLYESVGFRVSKRYTMCRKPMVLR
jgi:mycothiol synthase